MSEGLPEGWFSTPISAVTTVNPRHPRDLADELEVSFVPMVCVSESGPDLNGIRTRTMVEVRTGFTHFAEGDVLFAKITPCMENGKGAVARGLTNSLGCGTTELHVLRPSAAIDAYYLYHFTHQQSFRKAAEAKFTGSAGQARVPVAFFDEAEIPLPPLPEQRRIVAKLEALLAKVDTSRKRLERIPVILKRFRQAVLAAACEGRLTEDWRDENPSVAAADSLFRVINETRAKTLRIPRTASSLDSASNRMVSELENPFHPDSVIPLTWAWVRFGDVIGELRNGISTRPEMEPPGTPILRISAVRGGSVDLNETRFLPNGDDHVPSSALREGDLLFTRYNGSIELLGVCGMVRDLKGQNLLYPDKLMRVRFDHEAILPAYAEIYFQSSKVHDRITEKSKSSAGQNGVSGGDIKAQAFALPPIEEQSEIVRRVAQLFTLADQIEARYLKAKTHVDRLTQSILAKAFRGELVPQDPNDEPAEMLLARLKAQPADAATSKRRGRPKKAAG